MFRSKVSDTVQEVVQLETPRQAVWPWRVGLMIDSADLEREATAALAEIGAVPEFQLRASAPPYETAAVVERERPDIIFAELALVSGTALEWLHLIRGGGESPLAVSVHRTAEPAEMIAALRAGASEFLSLPLRPGLFEAMDRIATQLEARQTATAEPGRLIGVLSAKGGCGATTLGCLLSAALGQIAGAGKVLMADLDEQSPSVHLMYRQAKRNGAAEAFAAVRRLNSGCWREYAVPVAGTVQGQPGNSVDMLAGTRASGLPESWRIDNLFRFVRRHYDWILADLGRHLTSFNWTFLPHMDELLIVTAPDVLALYQTRCVLQTLTNRGFEKSKVRLILNRNQDSPQDFWIESIEQMFDMSVTAVLPYDAATLSRMPRDEFVFPASSAYGRAVSKLAARILKPGPTDQRTAGLSTAHRKTA